MKGWMMRVSLSGKKYIHIYSEGWLSGKEWVGSSYIISKERVYDLCYVRVGSIMSVCLSPREKVWAIWYSARARTCVWKPCSCMSVYSEKGRRKIWCEKCVWLASVQENHLKEGGKGRIMLHARWLCIREGREGRGVVRGEERGRAGGRCSRCTYERWGLYVRQARDGRINNPRPATHYPSQHNTSPPSPYRTLWGNLIQFTYTVHTKNIITYTIHSTQTKSQTLLLYFYCALWRYKKSFTR